MPANLTPQYQKAEKEYRQAHDSEEQVECLQRMLRLIPKHKGTEKLQADLKSKLKDAKSEVETEKSAPKKGRRYRIPPQGAGQLIVIGAPNSGKSRLLADLTSAEPSVAAYPFTTREPMAGMMPWEDATVQLIDTPPITDSHFEPYLLNIVRASDGVLLCFDGSSDDAPDETATIINQYESRKTLLSNRTGFDVDDFSTVHIKTLLVVTRADAEDCDERIELFREMVATPFEQRRVEFDRADSGEALRDEIYSFLNVIRVYTKRPGKPAERVDPFTIPKGGNIDDLAHKVHRELAETLKFARVWGTSAHDGQTVGRDHELCDKDTVELHH